MIRDQIAKYRELNAQSKNIKAQMDELKSEIEQEVKNAGEFSDSSGYAKLMTRKSSISCKNAKGLSEQATIWSESEDATMQANGKTVLTYLNPKAGYEYLALK